MTLSNELKAKVLSILSGKKYEYAGVVEFKTADNPNREVVPYEFSVEPNQIAFGKIETFGVGGTTGTELHLGFFGEDEKKPDHIIDDSCVELGNSVAYEGYFQFVKGTTEDGVLAIQGDIFTLITD